LSARGYNVGFTMGESLNPERAELYHPGDLISGRYRLEELLGVGGMGAVWRARNLALDAPVAIKVLGSDVQSPDLRLRLLIEARAAAKLAHPAIVKVFDVGETDRAEPYIVMELLSGTSLGAVLRDEARLSAVQAVRMLLPIADALRMAHAKGIVHRDVKPDNIFIVHDANVVQPKLLDFGIVKVERSEGSGALTQDGVVMGSPTYLSPEQARGADNIDHRADVWAFAVVLFEVISGRMPFDAANYNALLRQIIEDPPPTLHDLLATDEELSAIVTRGLQKRPEERFQSMTEMGRALAQWLFHCGETQDICGISLESKWLREPDLRESTPFAAAWLPEPGSGVRRPALGPATTLPAPAWKAASAGSGAPALARPSRVRHLLAIGGLATATALVVAWVNRQNTARVAAPTATPGAAATLSLEIPPTPSAPTALSTATLAPAASAPVALAPAPSASLAPSAAPPSAKAPARKPGVPRTPARPKPTNDLLRPY
jgi:hypothetical protein